MHKKPQSPQDSYGFSLVELSIVLVILGLLVGGILAGQSLIRASELRSVTTQYQRYITATQAFRDKYFTFPGDMPNAVAFWGAADGSTGMTAACQTAASTNAATCNGDGNGQLTFPSYSNEPFRFWQHLANAGLIEGSFSGVQQGSTLISATTANAPAGKIGSGLWFVYWYGVKSANASIFDGNYNNILEFGGVQTNNDPGVGIFKPEEAWNLDTKMDDGQPATGRVIARDVSGFTGTNCTTATSSSVLTATYVLTNTNLRCVLIFPQLF